MSENDTRLKELGVKAVNGNMNEEEFAELAKLSRAKQQLREGRTALITSLQQSLRNEGVTIHELYSAAEIAAAVPTRHGELARPASWGKQPRKAGASAKHWVRQKSGLVLIQVNRPGSLGTPCRYCKGQQMAYYVPANLKQLDDGNLEANLERCYTEDGKQYFATDEGRAELARLVEYVRTGKVKPKR